MTRIDNSELIQNAADAAKKRKVTDDDLKQHFKDAARDSDEVEFVFNNSGKKKNEYVQRNANVPISPARFDPFAADATPTHQTSKRTFASIVQEENLNKEKSHLESLISQQQKKKLADDLSDRYISSSNPNAVNESPSSLVKVVSEVKTKTRFDATNTPSRGMWAETPVVRDSSSSVHKHQWDSTPALPSNKANATPGTGNLRSSRWDVTPVNQSTDGAKLSGDWTETPKNIDVNKSEDAILETQSTATASRRKSRWDETPSQTPGSTVGPGVAGASSRFGTPVTPSALPGMNLATPMTGTIPFTPSMTMTPTGPKAMAMMTPSMTNYYSNSPSSQQTPIDTKFKVITDEEIDAILPKSGFKIHQRPANYIPIKHNMPMMGMASGTPTPLAGPGGFFIPQSPVNQASSTSINSNMQPAGDLPQLKESDLEYFDKLLKDTDTSKLSGEQVKEREIMTLLLKVKNGTPQMRKSALREITRRAQEFGPGPLLNQILPLLMSPSLEDQERHLMVKVIDRLLYKLDDAVRPYVHKILVVIEPMLIDEDYFARVEGREIISNLAKAAGLATMIATMRPDIDHTDEYVRNTTARAFAVVASSLGVGQILPFLKAVCRSTKSWQARHTGVKVVQQIAILMGCSILPHLKGLVETIEQGLNDDELKVRVITALAISALAEAATPYGIESFDSVLKPLWTGIRTHRGKSLAALLKAIGYLIPLMDSEYAFRYTCEVMSILIREFNSPDEEMKKIVLKVVKQCCSTDGVEADYIRSEILPSFFRSFWTQRMALDRRNYQQLVDTTVEIASKVGSIDILTKIVDDLKDESEGFRKMVMETIERIVVELGIDAITTRMEEQLIDGCLYAYQEQISDDVTMLNGFGAVINALGLKARAYLPQISATVLWRLNNKNHRVRQQAADLISKIAPIVKLGQEDKLLSHLSLVLFEYLGEEYPEVLGSIIGALKSIVSVVGMTKMTPPIKDLLPRLTPILKNRHEKVQENCVELVGRIADRGAEFVSAREWMRICFELLESLKAHKKSIRRAAVNTFGYIAKAIGPHDVLTALLNNLKVQERQLRICTTVAIAIVAETCSPFTVLPSLMNEYRVPDLNVQHGVLKTLSFMFEYIGEMAKDYIYAVIPLLEDALMERDVIHRQTSMYAIGHLSVGVAGFGNGDSLNHLLNLLWPNIFETSPHVVQAFMNCIDGMRLSLGAGKILLYVLQGLFHPARRVREAYWRVYNAIYIGAEDSLTPYYPRIFNTDNNDYIRHELDYVL